MTAHELTNRALPATSVSMQTMATGKRGSARRGGARQAMLALGVVMGGAMALGGCVSVNAPDKPIVIELNINIKADVVYKLAADAENTVEDNPEVF